MILFRLLKKCGCIALVVLASLQKEAQALETTVERLGFSPTDKVLIIHADDIGMGHTVNRATFSAFQFGLVKSGSVMAPCPWFSELKEWNKDLDLGVHVTLTSEWKYLRWSPLLRAPGLSDDLGFFWPNVAQVLANATPGEVEREVEAQIQQVIKLGIKPSHLDTHMGTHFAHPSYLRSVIKLGEKYGIPPMLVRWSDELKAALTKMNLPAEEIRKIVEDATRRGHVALDYLVLGVKGKDLTERKESYKAVLSNLKPGVTQLIVHLGHLDEEMKGIMVQAPEGFERRNADYLVFMDKDIKNMIKDLGIKLMSWKELGKLSKFNKKQAL